MVVYFVIDVELSIVSFNLSFLKLLRLAIYGEVSPYRFHLQKSFMPLGITVVIRNGAVTLILLLMS